MGLFGNLGKWGSFIDQYGFGGALGALGTAFNAPEVYASEKLGSSFPTKSPVQYVQPRPQKTDNNSGSTTGIDWTSSGSTGGTQSTGQTAPAPSSSNPIQSGPSDDEIRRQQEEEMLRLNQERLRGEISSGWDDYINSLNQQLEGLSTQRGAQEGIVESQFRQGKNTLDLQKTQGEAELAKQLGGAEQTQSKNLQDLASNIRTLFRSGANYLGAMGAGDSSAANQYSYALTKMGSQQRTDLTKNYANIVNDIKGRETNLKNIYDTEIRNLEETKNQKINSIVQWFGEQQNAIKQAQAKGQLGKSQDLANLSKDILNRAISEIDRINQSVQSRKDALDEWAMSNADTIQELKNNLAQVSNVSYNQQQFQPLQAGMTVDQSGGQVYFPGGGMGGRKKEDESIFADQLRDPIGNAINWGGI